MSTEEEAVSALRRGDIDFAVVVPSNLEEQIMNGEEARLQWILGRDGTLNVVGETLFTRFTDELNRQVAMVNVFGPEVVAAMASSSESDAANSSYIAISSPGKAGTSYSASQYY
ncbi:hypothetical protein ACTHQ2_23775, partial [Bacillus subtilis]